MDTLSPARPAIALNDMAPPVVPAIPEFETLKHQAIDTARRLQVNIQNMPLTSFALAIIVGVSIGTLMTRASYVTRIRH